MIQKICTYSIFFLVSFSLLILGACTPKVTKKIIDTTQADKPTSADSVRMKHANELAHKFIIVDGHVDLPYRLRVQNFQLTKEFLEIPIKSDKGDFDYERSKGNE